MKWISQGPNRKKAASQNEISQREIKKIFLKNNSFFTKAWSYNGPQEISVCDSQKGQVERVFVIWTWMETQVVSFPLLRWR